MNDEPEPYGPKTLNEVFYDKAIVSFRELFQKAKETNELQFAFSLSPEFRGCQGPGWNTAEDAQRAFDDYARFIKKETDPGIRARVALSFYSHVSEASGFYEIPKNMLRVAEGLEYNLWPYRHLVQTHKITGAKIAPNSNKVICDLVGHAESIGLHSLAEVFRDAFDPDIRNGYAHADYVIWDDGIRLPKRNGGYARIVDWREFDRLFERAINFFLILSEVVDESVRSYDPPKQIRAALKGEPAFLWTIGFNPAQSSFSISTSHG